MVEPMQVAAAGVLGGLLTIERRAFLQAMLSRPLASASLVGLAMGDVTSGLYVGMLLELAHLGSASLGAALPQHDTLVATGTAACAAAMSTSSLDGSTPAQVSLSILLFAELGRFGRFLDKRLDRYAARVTSKALKSAERGELDRAMHQNLWAMWPTFFVFGGLTALCACVGFLLGPLLHHVPVRLLRGLSWAYPAMASVIAAMAVRGSHSRKAGLYAGGAAALVAAILLGLDLFHFLRSPGG